MVFRRGMSLGWFVVVGISVACDPPTGVMVGPGESFTAASGAFIVGMPAGQATLAGPGVAVTNGDVTVDGGSVLGGANVTDVPPVGEIVLAGGEGIAASGGRVLVRGDSLVQGGRIETTSVGAEVIGAPGAGLAAVESEIRVEGGRIAGGDGRIAAGDLASSPGMGIGIDLRDSVFVMTGGVVQSGTATGGAGGGVGSALEARGSDITIGGGQLGTIVLRTSLARMVGGTVESAVLVFEPGPLSCLEIRGGTVGRITQTDGNVVIVGSGFNFPTGLVTQPGAIRIEGTLEDGSPISASVQNTVTTRTQLRLAAPGDPGCVGG